MSHLSAPNPHKPPSRRVQLHLPQQGLTLIELLVAMAIGLLITMAAVSALTFTRRGHATVDASSQLEDNIRFTTDLIQRIGVQAGYLSASEAAKATPPTMDGFATDPDPHVSGFNNAKIVKVGNANTYPLRTASAEVGYGSDVLILRYQTEAKFPDSADSDGSMIDCVGEPPTSAPDDRYDRVISILHVAEGDDGEPTLMCNSSTGDITDRHNLISGVENFQVLYGTRGVTPNTVPAPLPAGTDTAAERYLRADQMVVAGNTAATNGNWRRVSSIRIGMVVRGPRNSQQAAEQQTFYPFGEAKDANGIKGQAITNLTQDIGTRFSPTADGRLRQTATFTIHLRNYQGL